MNLEIKKGDKISLIGENGCGKTTILNIISGFESADSGTVAIRNGVSICYLSQQDESIYGNKLVKDNLYDSLEEILKLEDVLKRYEEKMNNNPSDLNIINKYLKA